MPPNFARQVWNDASLNPCFLHGSLTGMPASASFRNPMIRCSVKRFLMFAFFSENELY